MRNLRDFSADFCVVQLPLFDPGIKGSLRLATRYLTSHFRQASRNVAPLDVKDDCRRNRGLRSINGQDKTRSGLCFHPIVYQTDTSSAFSYSSG